MRYATTVFLLLLTLLIPRAARAQSCESPECFFGTADCTYFGSDQVTLGTYTLKAFTFWGFLSPCIPFPPLGSSTTTSVSVVADFQLSSGGVDHEYYSQGTATVHLSTTGANTVQSEVQQLDLSGNSLPAGMMLRESPTLQSTGEASSTVVSGHLLVASSFDWFAELSTDSGQTWLPASGPEHLALYPGVPTLPRTWGSVKATYR